MTLHIIFDGDNPGEQRAEIENVRWVTVYPMPYGKQEPEVVIHFMDYKAPQRNIPLSEIWSLNISNG